MDETQVQVQTATGQAEKGNGADDTAEVIVCCFPDCNTPVKASEAWAPSLRSIEKKIEREEGRRRSATAEDVQKSALCFRHSSLMRENGIRTFRLETSLAEVERRRRERKVATNFAKLFADAEEDFTRSKPGPGRRNNRGR